MNKIKKRRVHFLLSVLLFLICCLYVSQKNKITELLKVSFLNIGQGDATLIRTPNQHLYMVDVSGGPQILEALSEELGFFEKTIDGVFLTHMDTDHVGGIIALLEYFTIKNIFVTSVFDEDSIYQDLVAFIEEENIETVITQLDGINKILLDTHEAEDIVADILFPIPEYPTKDADRNNRSLVIKVLYGDTSILFTGDASVEIEEYLIKEYERDRLQSDILQVGHHGSNTSSGENFLKVVGPEYAVISFGENNDFGHPHGEVVSRLEEEKVKIFDTKEKTITFIVDGDSVVSI